MKDTQLWTFHQNQNRSHLQAWYPRQDMILKWILKHIPRWKEILEIGFWDGYLLKRLDLAWYKVFWQDISRLNLGLTSEQWKPHNITLLLGDETGKLHLKNEELSGFIASEVLEHMSDEELEKSVKEIYRTLKTEWYAFITVPAEENLKWSECACPNCGEVFHKWWHKQRWNKDKILKTFSIFEILIIEEFFNRYIGDSIWEKFAWYGMYYARSVINKFRKVDNRSYFILLRKP